MKRTILVAALVLIFGPLSDVRGATTYTVDGVHSTVEFGVSHLVISTVKGDFSAFSGTVIHDDKDPASWKIEGTIDAASISTGNEKRDAHLKSPDFLDTETHGEITFRSSKIRREGDRFVAAGEFTLRGVTKAVEIPFTLAGPITDPWGNRRIGLQASWTLNRHDYGVAWSQTMDGGGLVVGDEVSIDLNIEAVHAAEGE